MLAATPALAQQNPDAIRRVERQLRMIDEQYRRAAPRSQTISERLLIDAGGSIGFGYYSIDDEFSNSHGMRQTDGRLYLLAELDGAHRFYGRLRFQYNDWNTGQDFDGRGDVLESPIGDEYWYQFDYRSMVSAQTGEFTDYNFNAKVGRQYVHWASGVSLSLPLYAALVDVEAGDWGFVGLAGLTPSRTVIDFDASRPRFDVETDRAFFGGMVEYRGSENHRPFVYALAQRDMNDDDFETFVGGGGEQYPTKFEYNSYYIGVGSTGNFGTNLYYSIEAVFETGRGQSNTFDPASGAPVDQREENINAWAGVASLSYLLGDERETRFDLEVIAGTGDDDRLNSSDTFGGNQPGTDDNSFNAFGLLNTGLAVGFEPANLLSLRFGVSMAPAPEVEWLRGLRLSVDGFLFHKIDRDAPVSVNTDNSSYIGAEIDVGIDWRITSDVFGTLRYGIFFPGDAMPSGEDDNRQFLYAGVTYVF